MNQYLLKQKTVLFSLLLVLLISLVWPSPALAQATPIPPNITLSGSCDGAGNSIFTITNTGGAMTVNYTWELYQNGVFLTSGPFTLTAAGNTGSSLQLTINGLYGQLTVVIRDNNGVQVTSGAATCATPTPTVTRTPTATPIPPSITLSGSCDGAGNSVFTITNTGGAMTVNYTWELYQNSVFLTSGPFTLTAAGNTGSSLQLTISGLYGQLTVVIRDNNGVQVASGAADCATPTPTVTRTGTSTHTATVTWTPTNTETFTMTPSPTVTDTATPTPTNTETFTPAPSLTPTNTATDTLTPTNTATFTVTPSPTATSTVTATPIPPTITNTLPPAPLVMDTVPKDGAALSKGPTQLKVTFDKDVIHDGSVNAADNPINYLLVEQGLNQTLETLTCSGGRQGDDKQKNIASAVYSSNSGAGPFQAVLNLSAPLPVGVYRLLVCGSTSIQDSYGNKINGGLDTVANFRVTAAKDDPEKLPDTGFMPGIMAELPRQPKEKAYAATELTLQIPKLGLKMPILGVPFVSSEWDVSWLGNNAGWLENSSFPTWSGNSVLTGHVWNADNTPGMFAHLNKLRYGDKIEVRMAEQRYTYEVTENLRIQPDQIDLAFESKSSSWLTLLTCEGFDEETATYGARRMVRAVLVNITIHSP
ncbi:sortase [Levilinea saccharolytica]|uniref:Sortase n=1 Tax=Levilinea saccharolytica TaxID=229921 RepID=A0A0P6X8B9_9CHLR|nr:sortase [Levilinea saccharolytica]KPL75673.1 hypothetical protein ADN01_17735 [Levilinea saccharolytica]GAP16606.1 LPXTG-site transpeptidase (sortase) family protein [Levilinea saccharolytica]